METVFLQGNPMHIAGAAPIAGSIAPDFSLVGRDLSDIALHDYKGKRLGVNIFPSLDTDVCAASVRRFNQDISDFPDAAVLCVSKDLPFAAARFCVWPTTSRMWLQPRHSVPISDRHTESNWWTARCAGFLPVRWW